MDTYYIDNYETDNYEKKNNTNTKSDYTHLILSGGGYSSLVYIGVYRYLLEYKLLDKIKYLYGTSAGAIFIFLIGLGIDYEKMEELFIGVNSIFTKEHYIKFDTSELFMFNLNKGVFSINRLKLFLEEVLELNYNIKDITFQEYLKKTGKDLHITSTCVNNCSLVDFCNDTHPNMSVLIAIMCSSAIPFIFQPVEYENLLYIDGGCINNIPINTIKKNIINKLLVINLTQKSIFSTKELKNNIFQYIWNTISSSLQSPINLVIKDIYDDNNKNIHIINMSDNKLPGVIINIEKEYIYTIIPKELVEESIIYGYNKIYQFMINDNK